MADSSITYFPIGNGDTSLIKLSDGATMVVDINFCPDDMKYDVHAHLLRECRTEDGVSHADAFLLSHPDQDHTRGFDTVFYAGDPGKYSENDKKKKRIVIDELWFSPRIFCPHEKDLCEIAELVKKEAERRMDVYKKDKSEADKPGNRIRIIGYTDNPDFVKLKDRFVVPGNRISEINGSIRQNFSMFIHAPTKKDTDSKWSERNDTSIVFQARFRVGDVERAALAMFGGDARCAIWEDIIGKSKEIDLEFDLFLAPHHCSWSFFSEKPSEQNEPSTTIVDFLKKRKRKGAIAISSSKPIKNDDDNPPHYIAKQKYEEILGEKNLICTGEHPSEEEPEPIYFTMTKNGPVKDEYARKSQVVSSAAIAATVSTPKTYG